MAAHPSEGPAVAQHSAPPPAAGIKAEPGAGGATKSKDEDAPAPEHDDEDGGAWDQASLYEEILDEVEAFEYSDDGESGLVCASDHNHH
jgi:NAD-dependent histone deacetylase SIR2